VGLECDTEDEAIAKAKELVDDYDEFQIFDTITRSVTTFKTKER